jgi:hypothetical protein
MKQDLKKKFEKSDNKNLKKSIAEKAKILDNNKTVKK